MLPVGADGVCLFGHFSLPVISLLFFIFSLILGDGLIQTEILSQRATYEKPKTTNQPSNLKTYILLIRHHVAKILNIGTYRSGQTVLILIRLL